MFRLMTISALVALASGNCPTTKEEGKSCGRNTEITKYPHHLTLDYKNRQICGASLILPNVALTAAHCTYGREDEQYNYRVRAGIACKSCDVGDSAEVLTICQHRSYDNFTKDYDVSLLFLSKVLVNLPKIDTIYLQPIEAEPFAVDIVAVVTGWEFAGEVDSSKSRLQEMNLKKIENEECQKIYADRKISDRMECYVEIDQGVFCKGEYGNALLFHARQVGIASWISEDYAEGYTKYPRVFTKVSHKEIAQHINNCVGLYNLLS